MPLEGATETGGVVNHTFDRVPDDQLPPQRGELGEIALRDEYPVLPLKLRCKGPAEGGSSTPSDFKLVRFDSLVLSVDPELQITPDNAANAIERVCFPSLTCVNR